jgi:hypothetical protein
MEKKFTIWEFKKYVMTQDSLGDVLYFLNERNVEKANKDVEKDLQEEYQP